MGMFWFVINTLATVLMGFSAAYFFVSVGLGFREVRRAGDSVANQSDATYGRPFARLVGAHRPVPQNRHVYFLIACLNEAEVIGETVRCLQDPDWRCRTIVVDDGSDDRTALIAQAAGGVQTTVVRRELPNARKGKGAALNEGFRRLRADVAARGLDPEQVIVCVMDADGRLSDGAMQEVLPLFDDPTVGGAQLAVRIRNRSTNFLLEFQDHQFWVQSSLTQFGRISTATVSLGGNGQFTRLSALLELGDTPWSEALTEDLDLAVSMAVRGWKLTTTPNASVNQQGLEKVGALVRQRTRWYQGHMMTGRRLPEVMRSTRMTNGAAVEMTLYLAVPWVFDLPWSVLYHLILVEIGLDVASQSFSGGAGGVLLLLGLMYLLGCWPALVTAIVARRRDRAMSWPTALKMGHAFVITNYLSYVCVWRALWRILRGRNGWVKTARIVETPQPPVREGRPLPSNPSTHSESEEPDVRDVLVSR